MTVRPWATVQVANDASGFASALGYRFVQVLLYRSVVQTSVLPSISQTIFKRGYSFRRGNLVIVMFQQEQVRVPDQIAEEGTNHSFIILGGRVDGEAYSCASRHALAGRSPNGPTNQRYTGEKGY